MGYTIDENAKYSSNFKVSEFACRDGTFMPMDRALIGVLQKIRDRIGKPVRVTSGYRSPDYNKKVGGAADSMHMRGVAADIQVDGTDPAKVAAYAETLMPDTGGIGLYTGQAFVHIDTREARTRWKEDKKGAGTYSVKGF